MIFNEVKIPDVLIDASLHDELVIFCGAGVSKGDPVRLCSFDELAEHIREDVDPGNYIGPRGRLEIDKEVKLSNSPIYTESPEQFLGRLEDEGKDIRGACASMMNVGNQFNKLHKNIATVFCSNGNIRIVTTNYDTCFENALNTLKLNSNYEIYCGPALPLGRSFNGLVHLHGIARDPSSMILTAKDFGCAYITDAWASRFLVDLFKTYKVLFIGYSFGDVLVDYLTRSLSAEITENCFAIYRNPKDRHAWQQRGIMPISINSFDQLPDCFREWGEYVESTLSDKIKRIETICNKRDISHSDEAYLVKMLQADDEEERCVAARVFSSAAKGEEFLSLLDKHQLLDFLTNINPDESEKSLLNWYINEFAVNPTDNIFKNKGLKDLKFSPAFYQRLFSNLTMADCPDSVCSFWLLCLEEAGYDCQEACMYGLLDIAQERSSDVLAMHALRILLKLHITYPSPYLRGCESMITSLADKVNSFFNIPKTMNNCSKKFKNDLFDYCFEQMRRAYAIQKSYDANANSFDSLSFGRRSISPHSQDSFRSGPVHLLIDLMRECINEANYKVYAKRCLEADENLLIRVGLWIKYSFAPSGNDLRYIVRNNYLENPHLHHEVYMLLREAFKKAIRKQRNEFIKHLSSLVSKNDRDSDYKCYNVCTWLRNTDEGDNCKELLELQTAIQERNPKFIPRDHLDFLVYSTTEYIGDGTEPRLPKEDFQVEKLLAMICSMDDPWEKCRLEGRIISSTRSYPSRALENASILLNSRFGTEEIYLFKLLISSINWADIGDMVTETVDFFVEAVSNKHVCSVAIGALYRCILDRRDMTSFSSRELLAILEAASANLKILMKDDDIHIDKNQSNWYFAGRNHPSGEYIELVAHANSLALSEKVDTTKSISNCLDSVFKQLSSKMESGKYVLACFFSHYDEFYDVMNEELRNKFVTALHSDDWQFISAWQGLSVNNRLSSNVWTSIKVAWPLLFKNLTRFNNYQTRRLITLYLREMFHHENQKEHSKLFKQCASASREALSASCLFLATYLETLDPDKLLRMWSEWIFDSLVFLKNNAPGGIDILPTFYVQCIQNVPELRPHLAMLINESKDYSKNDMILIQAGKLSEIAHDDTLSFSNKITLLCFLIERSDPIIDNEDLAEASRYLESTKKTGDSLDSLYDLLIKKNINNNPPLQ